MNFDVPFGKDFRVTAGDIRVPAGPLDDATATVLTLRGRLTAVPARLLQDFVESLIGAGTSPHIAVDMTDVYFVSRDGLTALDALRASLDAAGGHLSVIGALWPLVDQMISANCDPELDVYATRRLVPA